MPTDRILLVSDIHWCCLEWYGVSTADRMERLVADIEAEHTRQPLSALLLLGDYSLDHWKWQVKGSYLVRGISNTADFVNTYMPRLRALGVTICMTAGNHEQYGEALWRSITGFSRVDHTVVGDVVYAVADTYGADLDPTEHSDGTYAPVDTVWLRGLLDAYPDKKLVLCAHHFNMGLETDGLKALLRSEPRILCLAAGHTHKSAVEQLGEDCGSKVILRTGHYAYSGEKDDPRRCMWGFREILVDENGLRSAYITPAQNIIINGEPHSQPYGRQDEYSLVF